MAPPDNRLRFRRRPCGYHAARTVGYPPLGSDNTGSSDEVTWRRSLPGTTAQREVTKAATAHAQDRALRVIAEHPDITVTGESGFPMVLGADAESDQRKGGCDRLS